MSLQLSLELSDATLADVESFLAAARSAQAPADAQLELNDTTLSLTVPTARGRADFPVREGGSPAHGARHTRSRRSVDTALSTVMDLLSERIDESVSRRGAEGHNEGSRGTDTFFG